MIDYTIFFQQNQVHDRWHIHYPSDVEQVRFYHRDISCPYCNPPGQNIPQFDNFWDWYSTENPAVSYTNYTQQALIDLDNSDSVEEVWEAIYLIVFSIRYRAEPRPYTEIRQEIYNASTLTNNFIRNFDEEIDQISVSEQGAADETSERLSDTLQARLTDSETSSTIILWLDEGLLYSDEDLNLNLLFGENTLGNFGLLYTDEDLYLDQLFEQEEEEDPMAMAGGAPNMNQLLNALNNLTNALGAGGNNMQNVNNALNNLNATVAANNNAMQNRGTQAAPVPTFYGGNQDPITWLNEFNHACAANGWNAARKLQVVPAYLRGATAV